MTNDRTDACSATQTPLCFAFPGADSHQPESREFVNLTHCPWVTDAETDNKCGLGSRTDAPNITSVAAQLAADKAERAFAPLLPQLGERVKHVLRRVLQMSLNSVSAPGAAGAP